MMPPDPGLANPTFVPLDKIPRKLEWHYPVWLATMGLVLQGSWGLLRLLLPHHLIVAYAMAPLFSLGAWKFGPRPASMLTLHTVWIGREAYSFFGFRQSVLNGVGYFLLLTAVLPWLDTDMPMLFDISMAAIGGLVFAAFGYDLQAPRPTADHDSVRT